MCKTIAIYNLKGGVGKTTLAWAAAAILTQRGHRILSIDLDSQCNLTYSLIGRSDPDNVLRAVPQTYGAFTSPVESFEIAIHREDPSIVFNDNPIIPYCFANCYLDEDKRTGNRKPLKRKANLKIDGAIVTLMDLWLFNNTERRV